jgi:hypothetical protein
VLEGHEELVRCIRFDSKRIVSGAYDGYVNDVCVIAGQLWTVHLKVDSFLCFKYG